MGCVMQVKIKDFSQALRFICLNDYQGTSLVVAIDPNTNRKDMKIFYTGEAMKVFMWLRKYDGKRNIFMYKITDLLPVEGVPYILGKPVKRKSRKPKSNTTIIKEEKSLGGENAKTQ